MSRCLVIFLSLLTPSYNSAAKLIAPLGAFAIKLLLGCKLKSKLLGHYIIRSGNFISLHSIKTLKFEHSFAIDSRILLRISYPVGEINLSLLYMISIQYLNILQQLKYECQINKNGIVLFFPI